MDKDKISKNQVKFIQSLKLKKYRQKYNKFVVEGDKMVRELQNVSPEIVKLIVARESWLDEHFSQQCKSVLGSNKEMEQMSQLKSSSDVLAVVHMDERFSLKSISNTGRYLYLHELNDPGNGGTIFRLADWFGFDGVFLSPDSVDVFNHKFVQSSMGSVLRVPFSYKTIEEIKSTYPLPLIGTSLDGQLLNEFKFPMDFILLLGNESKGLPPSIIEECQHSLLIDKQWSRGAESLNIGMSAGILMHQSRQ